VGVAAFYSSQAAVLRDVFAHTGYFGANEYDLLLKILITSTRRILRIVNRKIFGRCSFSGSRDKKRIPKIDHKAKKKNNLFLVSARVISDFARRLFFSLTAFSL